MVHFLICTGSPVSTLRNLLSSPKKHVTALPLTVVACTGWYLSGKGRPPLRHRIHPRTIPRARHPAPIIVALRAFLRRAVLRASSAVGFMVRRLCGVTPTLVRLFRGVGVPRGFHFILILRDLFRHTRHTPLGVIPCACRNPCIPSVPPSQAFPHCVFPLMPRRCFICKEGLAGGPSCL